jgi:prevent-host-death family protein
MANFMEKSNNYISVSEFKKKHFLSLVDAVKTKYNVFIITKRGIPVARIVPLENDPGQEGLSSFFGCMKGTAKIKDNIISFSSELDWEVVNG